MTTFTTIARFFGWFRSTLEQQRSLLHTIHMSAAYGLPLAPAVQALADDETGFHAERLQRLARLLNSECSLPDALELVPRVLPDSARSQIRFGIESGNLKSATRDAIQALDDLPHHSMKKCYDSLVGLAITVILMTWIVTFIMLKIVPTFRAIFEDFGMDMAPPMELIIEVCNVLAGIAPFIVVFAACFFLWVWFGNPLRWLRRSFLHPIARFLVDVDTPDLLRQIALTREAGKPVAGSMSTLARCHHNPRTRRQILRAWNEVEHGLDPWDALERQKLIRHEELKVIRASETLGNTPWALRQLANVRQSRTHQRLQVVSRLFPVFAMLLVAAFVALLAVGTMSTLTTLVHNLS